MKVLLTGGLGFIGSHTAVELINSGYDVVIVDDLSNSKLNVLDNIKKITKKSEIPFYKINIACGSLYPIFDDHPDIECVMHFAGYKAVGESVKEPYKYYRNNLDSTMTLLYWMDEFDINKIIFSSSATVYDNDRNTVPFNENSYIGNCTNPYGWTKYISERIISDYVSANNKKAVLLRYFNPIGAHPSGLIGENPKGIPNNLVPYIAQVATGQREFLSIYGNDYDTKDGTGVRDYIHIVDLANAHVKALEYMDNNFKVEIFNVGTGEGYSVLDVVNSYSKVNNVIINYKIVNRRDGDVAECYADNSKIKKYLGWNLKYNLDDMCRDSYNYQINHRSDN